MKHILQNRHTGLFLSSDGSHTVNPLAAQVIPDLGSVRVFCHQHALVPHDFVYRTIEEQDAVSYGVLDVITSAAFRPCC